jgi:cytochrome c peroxidase
MSDCRPSSSNFLKKNGSRVSAIRIEIRIPWQAMLSGCQGIELTEQGADAMSRTKLASVGTRAVVSTALTIIGFAGFGTVLGAPPTGLTIARDRAGYIGTYSTSGADATNAFFQSLGTNGRSCSTCHVAAEAMSFTPMHAQRLYESTHGADPLFASVDGANCSTVATRDRAGHSLLLKSGLIRIPTPVPPNAEFSISVVHDPYGCALRIDPKTQLLTASVYRRPLPTANVSFLSAVMFDGRETILPLTSTATLDANLRADLIHQATDATLNHAQAAQAPNDAQLESIVDFELGTYSAQYWDDEAGLLSDHGAQGGPVGLANQLYYPGINDTLGADPNGIPFTPVSMSLFSAWEPSPARHTAGERAEARARIAAGEKLFNSAPMMIANVRGLNDNAALNKPASFSGTCATCHDTPNIGHHSLPLPLDIGTGHSANTSYESDPVIAGAVSQLSMPDLPVFLISGCTNPFSAGQVASFYTTDPGRALITGHCADFNRVKGPILRGLAARAPYFHNGSAADLRELVNFYNQRFAMALNNKQEADLVAFLNSL